MGVTYSNFSDTRLPIAAGTNGGAFIVLACNNHSNEQNTDAELGLLKLNQSGTSLVYYTKIARILDAGTFPSASMLTFNVYQGVVSVKANVQGNTRVTFIGVYGQN